MYINTTLSILYLLKFLVSIPTNLHCHKMFIFVHIEFMFIFFITKNCYLFKCGIEASISSLFLCNHWTKCPSPISMVTSLVFMASIYHLRLHSSHHQSSSSKFLFKKRNIGFEMYYIFVHASIFRRYALNKSSVSVWMLVISDLH